MKHYKLKIRKFKKGEERKVSYLCQRCIKEINSKDLTKKETKSLSGFFTPSGVLEFIKDKETEMFVILKNEKIIGTASLTKNRARSLFVNPSQHGLGAGNKLMNHIEKLVKKQGYKKIFLFSSKYAEKFYKKRGYTKIKKLKTEVGPVTKMEKIF